jgi:hypothetical protein
MNAAGRTNRILFIDVARFYAIALVFYGHFVEELMLLKNPAAAAQYKFIYAFHMVLFIVIAGYVANERRVQWRFGKFLKHQFTSRLLPFIFFTFLMMIPPVFFDGKFFGLELPSIVGYGIGLANTVFGLPSFCIPSWFLLLIIGMEFLHYLVFRFIKDANAKLLLAAIGFYVVGYWFKSDVRPVQSPQGPYCGLELFFHPRSHHPLPFLPVGRLPASQAGRHGPGTVPDSVSGCRGCVPDRLVHLPAEHRPFSF